MLVLSLLLLFPAVWARYYEFSLASVANVIPPGNTNISLFNSAMFKFLAAVGSPGLIQDFRLTTLFPNVMAQANSSNSSTYVATGLAGSISLPSYYGSNINTTGNLAYEYFNFGGLSLQGRGFVNISGTGIPMVGIGFGQGQDLGIPNFVENLYNQAQLAQKVVGFAYSFSATGTPSNGGTLYLGGYNASKAGGPFIQYPVQLNTEYWGYKLTNVAVNSTSLGYNGLLAVDTGFSFTIVPLSLFNLLIQLILPPNVTLVHGQGNTFEYVVFDCTSAIYLALPNITFYLGGQPFVMTPSQYITYDATTSFCLTNIAGSLPGYVAPAPFILGGTAFNSTLSVFNVDNRTMSVAPLSAN